MKAVALLAGASAIATVLSVPAFAQTEIATGANAAGVADVNDQLIDIQDAVADDFARSNDADRFGPQDRRQGLSGGVSMTYSGSDGNDESQDFALAGRMSYNQGKFAQSVGLGIEYGNDSDGDKDTEEVYAIYDAQYYFSDRFYAFGLGRINQDGMVQEDINSYKAGTLSADDTTDLDGANKRDAFLGFGPGYRIINTADTAWRVQAGVGIRYTQSANLSGTEADYLTSTTETGYIASSRFYHRFNDMVFITNDTDYLTSDSAGDEITNEFGVNFKMSDQLATRVSYMTEYQENRAIRTDNTLGVSLVYGF
ncbi:MAG: YdiY family protein [Paracoccus sp. (in: a-proteobacteria)]